MIDTVKFKVPLTQSQFDTLIKKSESFTKFDHKNKRVLYRFISTSLLVGSYDRKVTFKLFSPDQTYVEFSIAKYHYGHNIYLLYPSQLQTALLHFRDKCIADLGDLPHLDRWLLYRLDFCYSWKFLNDEIARNVLNEIKKLQVSRKKTIIWDDSILFKGRRYSSKFYMKKPEYYYHDFREIKKYDEPRAHDLLERAEGILRFEVTMRKQALDDLLDKNIYADTMHLLDYVSIGNHYLKKIVKGIKGTSTSRDAFEKLSKCYKPSKARALWTYWYLYFNEDLEVKKTLMSNFHRQSNWRNLRDIVDAGVGLPEKSLTTYFELTIPSDIAVNSEPWR